MQAKAEKFWHHKCPDCSRVYPYMIDVLIHLISAHGWKQSEIDELIGAPTDVDDEANVKYKSRKELNGGK